MKQYFILGQNNREHVARQVMYAADGMAVTIGEQNRNLSQNAAQWPILQAFSEQLEWPVNGQMVKMSSDDWKDLLTAAFKRETQRVAMGLDGGMVMLGARTSQFGKREFGEWLEYLHAVAANRGVELYEVPA